MKKVYLAGTISGGGQMEIYSWRQIAYQSFKSLDIEAYSPLRGKAYVNTKENMSDEEKKSFQGRDINSIVGINVRDFNDCKTADAILVNLLDAPKVSIGTVMEIAWARAFQIPVVIVMEEYNLHQHGMLTFGNIVVDNIYDGIDAIAQLLKP